MAEREFIMFNQYIVYSEYRAMSSSPAHSVLMTSLLLHRNGLVS